MNFIRLENRAERKKKSNSEETRQVSVSVMTKSAIFTVDCNMLGPRNDFQVNVSDYVLISPCWAGTFFPQTFNFLWVSLIVSILFFCKVKFALSFMRHGSTSRTQSHSTTQAWVNFVAAFFYFLPISNFILCAAERNDGKSTAKWWTGGRRNRGEEIDAGSRVPSLAEHNLYWKWTGKKKNWTVKIFLFLFHRCSAIATSKSGAEVPEGGTRAVSRVTDHWASSNRHKNDSL